MNTPTEIRSMVNEVALTNGAERQVERADIDTIACDAVHGTLESPDAGDPEVARELGMPRSFANFDNALTQTGNAVARGIAEWAEGMASQNEAMYRDAYLDCARFARSLIK